MPQVVWTPVAEADLDDILFYIAAIDRRPATGARLYDEIRGAIQRHIDSRTPGPFHPQAPDGWLIDAVRDLPRHLGSA